MARTLLLALVGLPAAGKSTVARYLSGLSERGELGRRIGLGVACEVRHVCYDGIEEKLRIEQDAIDFSPELWHQSRDAALAAVSKALQTPLTVRQLQRAEILSIIIITRGNTL